MRFHFAALIATVLMLGACAQGRKSYTDSAATIFAPIEMCSTDGKTCMQLTVNYTGNYATLNIEKLANIDIASGQSIPFRVLARQSGESNYDVLADNISQGAGSSVQVNPLGSNSFIENYVDWHIESTENFGQVNGINTGLQPAPAGQGYPLIHVTVSYDEITGGQATTPAQ